MPSKYEFTEAVLAETVGAVSASPQAYMKFLNSAAQNYKYTFSDQLLIYAQRPKATACADIGTWNRLGRWVNRGTKGIALLDTREAKHRLRYVFDVADTNSFYNRDVYIWQMRNRHRQPVIDALENSFGEISDKSALIWRCYKSPVMWCRTTTVTISLSSWRHETVVFLRKWTGAVWRRGLKISSPQALVT